jgi:hypothetical protein
MRAARVLALLAAIALALAGCGSSGGGATETAPAGAAPGAPSPPGASVSRCASPVGADALRAHGIDCPAAALLARGWLDTAECRLAAGRSRSSCGLGAWHCLGVKTSRGTAVSCARRGRSIAFLTRR